MNKYQQALENMKHHIVGVPVLKWFYTKDADTIQELVNRATPKKPVNKNTTGLYCESCPNCGSLAMDDSDYGTAHDYCPNCGQALDRSDHWSRGR